MELIETHFYQTKVGLFIHEYNTICHTMGSEIGKMLLPGAVVMYDYKHEELGVHLCRIIGKNEDGEEEFPNHFVMVPEGYEDEMLEEYVE